MSAMNNFNAEAMEAGLMEMREANIPFIKSSKKDIEKQQKLMQIYWKEMGEKGYVSDKTIDDFAEAVFDDSFLHILMGHTGQVGSSSNSRGGDGQGSSSTRGMLRMLFTTPVEHPVNTQKK